MSNKSPGQSRYRHRQKDLQQRNWIAVSHLVSLVQGCTCGEQRIIQSVAKGHLRVKHLEDCPMRHAGTQWILRRGKP